MVSACLRMVPDPDFFDPSKLIIINPVRRSASLNKSHNAPLS
jgi:hypothetical protein